MNKENIVSIQADIDLSSYNSLGVSAVASVFVDISSPDQLYQVYNDGFFKKDSPFVLGGGSNVLFLRNPSRPVLKMSIEGKQVVKKKGNFIYIKIGAGENWHRFVTWAVENGYGGVENLALIPGTVGAAPIQNIGAYGVELEEVFESLELFDMRDGSVKTFKKEECKFGYRDSIFKNDLRGRVIVTSVTLKLSAHNHTIRDEYKSLQSYLQNNKITDPGIKDVFNAVIDIRTSKLPDPKLIGNAGSFFKNPVIDQSEFEELQKSFDDIPFYTLDETKVKIPAAWLIEQAGWKGKREGDVGTYQNQALVIVNHGDATGSEIFQFSKKIQRSVLDKFGIELVPEVNIVE